MTLPRGWSTRRLDELVTINPGHDLNDIDRMVSFVPMAAVDEQFGEIRPQEHRRLASVWKGYTHFSDGDVVFAKITPCMENGKAAVARGLKNGLACGSTEFFVLRPSSQVSPEYLWRYVRQRSFRATAEQHMTGAVGQRRVPRSFIEGYQLPLPPLAEQHRIVAKLDALTARLARARAELERTTKLLRNTKAAAITSCFSNVGGDQVALGSLLRRVEAGKNMRCNERPPRSGERGVVKVSAVTWGRFDEAQAKTLPADYEPPEQARIAAGDLLISRANTIELVGAVALVENAPTDLYLSDKILRLVVDDTLKSWLMWFLRSAAGRTQIESLATGNQLSMRNISQDALKRIVVPQPSPKERADRIVQLEATLARADRLEAEAARARTLLDRLEAAVLAKAFRGDLVPQDPADEPASVLLDRIRTERAAAPKSKRGRRSMPVA